MSTPAYDLIGTEVEQEAYLVRRGWTRRPHPHHSGQASWRKPSPLPLGPGGMPAPPYLGHTTTAVAQQVEEDLAQLAELQAGLAGFVVVRQP